MHDIHFDLLKIKKIYFFVGAVIFLLLVNYITQISFLGEQIYFNTFAENLSSIEYKNFTKIIRNGNGWAIFFYQSYI